MASQSVEGAALVAEIVVVCTVIAAVAAGVACLAAFAPEPLNLLCLPGLVFLAVTARLLAIATWPHALVGHARHRSR